MTAPGQVLGPPMVFRPDPVPTPPNADWWVFSYGNNPLPGDIGQIWDYEQHFDVVARNLRSYQEQLSVDRHGQGSSEAITELRQKQLVAAKDMAALATRFEHIRDALDHYWPKLRDAQIAGNNALAAGLNASRSMSDVLRLEEYNSPSSALIPDRQTLNGRYDTAQTALNTAKADCENAISARDQAANECAGTIDSAGNDSLKDNDWEFHRFLAWTSGFAAWVNLISGTLALAALVIPPPLGEAIAGVLAVASVVSGLVALLIDLVLADGYHDDKYADDKGGPSIFFWDILALIPAGRLVRFIPGIKDLPLIENLERDADLSSQGAQDAHAQAGANPWWSPWVPPNPWAAPIPALERRP